MPKDPENWLKKHIARLNIPSIPEIAPRDNTRVRKTGRAALVEAARLVGGSPNSIGAADPASTDLPRATVQSQYRPRYDKAITGATQFLPPVFGFEGGKETAHQVNAGNYTGAAATAALTLLTPDDAGGLVRKLTGKGLPKIARAAIKLPDGSIHWGRSHAAAIDAALSDGALSRKNLSSVLEKSVDGFVDAKGNFLTRAQTADRIRALGVKLPKDMRDGNFTSEELLGLPSIRKRVMVEPGSLPHQGTRSFDESFPSVGEVQVRAKGARKGSKPTPAAVADSALARVTNAAIRLPDGSIHEGRSHWPAIEAAVKSGKLPPPEHPNFEKMLQQSEDGFVDANGNFLTREETTHRMRALGHDIPAGFPAGSLTSEEVRGFNKPTPAAVADSVLSFARPTLTDFNTLDDYRAALARERAGLAGAGLAPRVAQPALDATTTDGRADAARVLRVFQHNSGAPNMPRITAVDKEKAAHMAKVYESLPKNDPAAREAYDALNKEVEQQFQAIIDNGHKIEFVDSDPYKSSKEMMEDVAKNRRLKVFKTPADNFHPYMTPEQNDKFRAVHDWLAHAGEGHQFGPMGEENAYRVHASTLSPLARRALATETRGQNSWVNFGPNAHLPVRERPFAEQKAALWPEEFLGDYDEMTPQLPESYGILTAENPRGLTASPEENAAFNQKLREYLHGLGYEGVQPTTGAYFDDATQQLHHENSFLVPGMTGPEAEALGKLFGQNGVVTNHGYHDLAAGKLYPSAGVRYTMDQPYTTLPNGHRFQMVPGEGAQPLMHPPAFYSRLERAIQGGQNKATPAQWLAQLSKNVNADERLFTGVDAFLRGADPKKALSRDEVMNVFKQGEIKLGRKTLGDPAIDRKTLMDRVEQLDRERAHMEDDSPEYEANWHEADVIRQELHNPNRVNATKFGQYTEPGGTNYRENLTTLEPKPKQALTVVPHPTIPGQYTARYPNGEYFGHSTGHIPFYATPERAAAKIDLSNGAPTFHSSHFDEPNILLHTRTKDRTANGERVLHAEEIQSDWHQKGREKGYIPNTGPTPIEQVEAGKKRLEAARQAYTDRLTALSEQHGREAYLNNTNDIVNSDPELLRLGREFYQADHDFAEMNGMLTSQRDRVPDAPFKKTDDWQLLGLKQLIDDAVRGGYNRIAWTPGDLQAERYSLSNAVDRIAYHPESGTFLAHQGGRVIHQGTYDPKALASVIGKEGAENLLRAPKLGNDFLVLEGDGLRVGGEGMRQFYDRMLPKNLNKYFKQLGLPSAEIEQIPVSGNSGSFISDGITRRGVPDTQNMIPSFPITPALWRQVVNNGQPLLGILGALGLGAGAWGAGQQQQQQPF